jgi:hypothetical protein
MFRPSVAYHAVSLRTMLHICHRQNRTQNNNRFLNSPNMFQLSKNHGQGCSINQYFGPSHSELLQVYLFILRTCIKTNTRSSVNK